MSSCYRMSRTENDSTYKYVEEEVDKNLLENAGT